MLTAAALILAGWATGTLVTATIKRERPGRFPAGELVATINVTRWP